ncbi:MAG: ATP-binding protein, partial [Verrucomicrobiales bacterium]
KPPRTNGMSEKSHQDLSSRLEQSVRSNAELQKRVDELSKANESLKDLLEDNEDHEDKLAEEARRRSEATSRALLEGSPVCNKIIDLDSRLQYMSAAGVTALKIPDIEALYGCTYPPEFFPEAVRAPMVEHLERAKAGEVCSVECPLVDTEGNTIWYHTTFVPARDQEGHIQYVIAASVNISERKQAEEDKLALERQLLHAQKFESLGVMAGAMAGEFNRILRGLMSHADSALDNLPDSSAARGHFREIGKASRRAAELADQMLAYSGKARIASEPIDVGKVVRDMVPLFEASVSENAALNCVFADSLPAIEGDAAQIRQIITNLIANASEAIGGRRGVIRLSTGVMNCDSSFLSSDRDFVRVTGGTPLAEGIYVFFEVSDTGCGMPAETIGKIYDPFFSTKQVGRGLGLSVVLGIVRAHKGAIEAHSIPGAGTTIRVLFSPADDRVEAPREREAEAGDFR